ncbi:MAG: small-conductance mechanosensitive channel [Saprospiraceae bacterium]|jgi:small-conductance mechanosensitive channel
MIEISLIVVSLVLILAATPITKALSISNDYAPSIKRRTLLMRVINVVIIALLGLRMAYPIVFTENNWLLNVLYVFATIYLLYLGYQIISYLMTRNFGEPKTVGEDTHYADTYSSRALTLFASVVMMIMGLILCVRILGFDSILEAGGVLGVFGVFLALTQSSWAPDIISGLVILNSRMVEEGDVLQLGDEASPLVGVVFKTKMFHTEILNLANNHRFMVRNTKLRDYNLHNLSKFASAKGLRECLKFNIDYAVTSKEVHELLQEVYVLAVERNLPIRESYEPEIRVLDTGDYAVKWGFFYYIKEVKQILSTRQKMRELVLEVATGKGILLATPVLQNVELNSSLKGE